MRIIKSWVKIYNDWAQVWQLFSGRWTCQWTTDAWREHCRLIYLLGPFDNISSLEFNNLQQNATLTKSCTNWIPESSLMLSSKTSICLDNGGLKAAFRAYRELQEGDPTRGTHIFQVSWFRERATFVLFLVFVLGLVQHIIGLFFPPALDCWDREPEEYYWPTMWISLARPFDDDILFFSFYEVSTWDESRGTK